ncbi:hypothetical protein O3P69_008508 [Scylla paramamosain]|uniref:Uncharacterized protein n=1 Tax=Scylla paramamosain TaxID=85552 RepID=A0AAW0SK91_SCYPA
MSWSIVQERRRERSAGDSIFNLLCTATLASLHRLPGRPYPGFPSTTAKAKFMCGGRRELQEPTQSRRNRPRQVRVRLYGYVVQPRFFRQSSLAYLAPPSNGLLPSWTGVPRVNRGATSSVRRCIKTFFAAAMRLPLLLLVALSWSALVVAQDAGPDYDYYEYGVEEAAPVADEAPAADLEAAPLSEDEPVEAAPVTEATTEKTTTTEATPKGRRRLISVKSPKERRRRPNVSQLRAGAATTASSTTESPDDDAETSGRGTGRRGRRPSRRGQSQTEATTDEAPVRGRGRGSSRTRPGSSAASAPSSPQTQSSSRRFTGRRTSGGATTEAPASTTASHRFSPRRRRPQPAQEEETPAPATPSRFGRRRQS